MISVRQLYDAVIVGSGPTGGYAAKRLSAAGMRVAVLDAGPGRRQSSVVLLKDRMRRWLGYRIEEDPAAVRRQPVQSSCYAWPEHPHAFVDDVDNPYVSEPDRPFVWLRSRHLGGRMVVRQHGLQFYRFSDLDFKAGERDGASPSWPLEYADLAPYYDQVERWMRLRGAPDALAWLPDSVLAERRDLNSGERLLAAAARVQNESTLIAGRTANRPMPILEALTTRTCTLRAGAIASRVLVDTTTAQVSGVAFVDRWTRRAHEIKARIVILCASSIETARLLLASATPQHPQGLANSSGALGRYLMDHAHLTGWHATMPLTEPIPSPSWAYITRFRPETRANGPFVRGYGIQVFTMWRECALTAFGEMLPHPDNRVTLDPDRTDRWGIPIVRISCGHRDNELAMARDQAETCRELLEAAGFETTRINDRLSTPGLASHEVGTARMGVDPATSVLNGFCQSWDIKNLFVMDGSCFVTQAAQNPTLTMLALTARSCDYLIDAYRRGDL
jgi:choline dehydrogenase-like flavoprotein